MRFLKLLFSIAFLALLASNVRSISHWTESRGVYDDICYLRQAHLFQRFGWSGFDTDVRRDDDDFLKSSLRGINYPDWKDVTMAPCHLVNPGTGKRVLTPPPGTGFVLSLFPEGFQAIPLYVAANVIITAFALAGLWLARRPGTLAVAVVFGAVAIYFMINPTKASYSLAPTMVVCALAGCLTARLFAAREGGRGDLAVLAALGVVLGLSASFRLPNVMLSAGYFVFFGLSFLIQRNGRTFLQALTFGFAFLVGMLPTLAANYINAGSPLATTYGGPDAVPPRFDAEVILAYLRDAQCPVVLVAFIWLALLWYLARDFRPLVLLVATNLVINLVFFLSHPVFTQYYVMPIAMLSLWTLLFASVGWAVTSGGPEERQMLSRAAS